MNFVKICIILSLVSFAIFAQDGAEECRLSKIRQFNSLMKANQINYPGDANYDVTYYKLDIALDYNTKTISGNVTCKAKMIQNGVSQIYYDLTDTLTVDSVLLNGTPANFSRGTNTLFVNLNSNLNIGDDFTTKVYYHGTPNSSGLGSFTFGTTPVNNNPTIYTLSEPYGAMDWWPCKDTPADKADSADIWITVADNFFAASNGTLESINNNGNSTRTFKWKVGYPIAHYLLSLAIADYYQYVNYYNYTHTDSMPITNYVYPESWNSTTQYFLDLTPQMIKVFAEHFGEYPFIKEKYGHAQFGWGGGMEHQTLTSLSQYNETLISHELTHMWYGDAITCKDWQNIWLNEGFATYGQGVWIESQQGKSGYDNFINVEMNSAKLSVGSIWVRDISTVWEIFNSNRSYAKGAVVLHMLRGIVGDSTFYDILRAYTKDLTLAYNVATTEDFQRVAQDVSGLDLNYFFQEWIYGENYPKYSVIWSKNQLGGGLWNLSLNVNQQVNTNPVFFTMPIQIKAQFANGDTLLTVFNNSQNQQFSYTLSSEPLSISFDPGNWILKDVSSVVMSVISNSFPTIFSLDQNYPNPFNPITKISWQVPESSWQTLKVYDILGNEVKNLVDEFRQAGKYELNFDASSLPSGVYMYTLKAGNFVESKKMILLK
jgi:aminopeptidase N